MVECFARSWLIHSIIRVTPTGLGKATPTKTVARVITASETFPAASQMCWSAGLFSENPKLTTVTSASLAVSNSTSATSPRRSSVRSEILGTPGSTRSEVLRRVCQQASSRSL